MKLRSGKSAGLQNKKYWNINLEPYIMFYSFLDQSVGRKLVHLRTPFSITNVCGTQITLNFNVRKKNLPDKWFAILKHSENYAIPLNIYDYDYLVTVNLEK